MSSKHYHSNFSREEFDKFFKNVAKDNFGFDFDNNYMYIRDYPDDRRIFKMGNIYNFAMQYPHITELFIRTNREFDNGIFDKSYFDMLNLVGNKTGDNTNYLKIVKDILTSNDPYTNFYLKYP